MSKVISLHEPVFTSLEREYVNDCIKSSWLSTSGKYIDKFESAIKKYTGAKHAIACNSGTSSLHISLLLANVNPGDEVIVPTLTFIAPVNTVSYLGAKPIFMDCDDYLNIDIDKTIEFINKETIFKYGKTINKKTNKTIKAIIVVHVYGNAANIEKLNILCRKQNIKIIEDASESLGTFYYKGKLKGRHTGTIGNFGCLSFNGNKTITSGGGGMILTNNSNYAKKSRYLIKQAKDDEINFIHNAVGYNYSMTNIHAAIGMAQFSKIKLILKKKLNIHKYYRKSLDKIDDFSLLSAPKYSKSNFWLNILKLNKSSKFKKNQLIKTFHSNNILVRPTWQLNHLQKEYKNCQKYKITNAYNMHESVICLPSGYNLKRSELNKVLGKLNG